MVYNTHTHQPLPSRRGGKKTIKLHLNTLLLFQNNNIQQRIMAINGGVCMCVVVSNNIYIYILFCSQFIGGGGLQ